MEFERRSWEPSQGAVLIEAEKMRERPSLTRPGTKWKYRSYSGMVERYLEPVMAALWA